MKTTFPRITLFYLLTSISGATPSWSQDVLPPTLPGPVVRPAVNHPRIEELVRKNQKFPTYAAYRELAELYVSLNLYEEAARAYREEAALFRRNGLKNAAAVEETKAARYDTEVRIFVERPLTEEEKAALDTKARLEPPLGAYVGAYIDLDDSLKDAWFESGRVHRKPEEFERIAGREHATYFMYIAYGKPVPYGWLEQCKRAGAIAHLAMEPNDLNAVRDDEYLRHFAQECGRLQVPILLRFASEMNGNWTDWHGKPALYREKFRLVHRVFHQYAPLVATAWCPNSVPLDNIMEYYPGDDGCDWVGINVYSVPFYGNDLKRSGLLDTALPFILPIYKMFSARKPIAICEFAASHMAEVDRVPRPEWAVSRMQLLYQALPRFFPRIKMVNWFNVNTIRHGSPGTPNNYALTENPQLLTAYRAVVQSSYFLDAHSRTRPLTADSRPAAREITLPRLVQLGESIKGNTQLSAWVKTPIAEPRVYVSLNNTIVYARTGNGAHTFTVNADEMTAGRKRLRVYVFDDKHRFVTTAATTVTVGRARGVALQLTGTVQRYYVDRAGMVSALDVETLGDLERIHFKPEQATQIMAQFPPLSEITAWVIEREGEAGMTPGNAPGSAPIVAPGTAAPGSARSWSLVTAEATDNPPATLRLDIPGDIERLESAAPVNVNAVAQPVEGTLTDVVQNAAGEVVALVLDNKTLVRVPRALRGAGKNATTIALNTKMGVTGVAETPGEGAVSIYNQRWRAAALAVHGQPATTVKFASKAGRGIRAATREDDSQLLEESVQSAQSAGLDVYEIPLPTSARFPFRGVENEATLRTLGVEPVTGSGKRPW